MPLYEYFCPSCRQTFETLRPAKEADAPVPCPSCRHASPQRILSLFANTVKTGGETLPVGMGSGCCGGSCGCHN